MSSASALLIAAVVISSMGFVHADGPHPVLRTLADGPHRRSYDVTGPSDVTVTASGPLPVDTSSATGPRRIGELTGV